MEYKSKYMADYHEEQAPKQFVVVQEVVVLKQFTVEADGMIDAILQIANGNYDCVIDEDASVADTEKRGRIISVRVNDDE